MPVKRTTSGLFGKLGAKLATAVEAHREDEIVLAGGIDLPAGIDFGIAQLVDCKFSVYKEGDNKGEYFFYAAGVVMSPEEITDGNGSMIPIKGLRTQIGPEPICDTPKAMGKKKTLDDHVKYVTDELRKLGAEGAELSGENLEATANALKETKPFFRFRTWKGEKTDAFPNPRVNHDWRGVCEYTDSGDSGVEDESPEATEEEAVEEKPKSTSTPTSAPKASTKGKPSTPEPEESDEDEFALLAARADSGDDDEDTQEAQRALDSQAKLFNIPKKKVDAAANWTEVADLIREASAKDEKPEAEEEATEEGETVDYDTLGSQADEGDEESINSLTELAEAAGLSLDDYPDSWASLATAISEQGGETEEAVEEEEAEEEQEFVPEVGGVFLYKFKDAKKATEVEITKIDEATKTCTVKNLDTGKKFAGIAFDKLEEAT
jgi:hypothetical protein